jgi:hypothetical protein
MAYMILFPLRSIYVVLLSLVEWRSTGVDTSLFKPMQNPFCVVDSSSSSSTIVTLPSCPLGYYTFALSLALSLVVIFTTALRCCPL